MLTNKFKAILKTALRVALILPFAAVVAFGQQTINLTALPTTATMPDGTVVPMWGYQCGAAVTGALATCRALNPNAPLLVAATATTPAVYGWSPVVITVPAGQILTINLTNSLTFTPTGAAANTVPTSLMIVGQLGGGLGTTATADASPLHGTDSSATWSTVAPAPFPFTPPTQGTRVRSFSSEVASGTTAAVTFGTATIPLRPGTYLMESGTHPSIQGPMGLYGMLVVTTQPGTAAGIAYPGVGTVGTAGYVAPVTYAADVDMLFSEIDANQNKAVDTAVRTAGFSETRVWSGQPGGCGNPSTLATSLTPYNTCYPPAVNYFPTNFAINGVPFNKTSPAFSLFPATSGTATAAVTGNVLVRLVNAGSKMHVPSIVGALTTPPIVPTGTVAAAVPGFSLVAEDGNLVPGTSRVQSDVFMSAGKTFDVMINAPAAGAPALPIFDRELSLSANGVGRDGGMIAYIGVNGSVLPAATGAFAPAVARADTYNSLVPCAAAPCAPLVVSDPGKGVIANDTNVYGVALLGAAPTTGTLIFNENGTFTFTPNVGTTSASFSYCANNGLVAATTTAAASCTTTSATVTLGAATIEAATGITMNNIAYVSNEAAHLKIAPPGPLSVDSDAAGYPLSVVTPITATAGGVTISMDPNGGFNASLGTPCTTATGCVASFTYRAKNSQGTTSSTAATVSITFQAASNLQVTVIDGQTKLPLPGTPQDYKWLIEEDRSMYIDPLNTTNTCTGTGATACTTAPTFGVQFHASDMPYVAQGCTGPKSCEGSSPATGQTMIDTGTPCTTPGVPAGCSATAGTHIPAVCDVGNGVCRPDTSTGFAGKTPVMPGEVHLDPTKRYYLSVLPGDAADPFYAASTVGHGMTGSPIPAACKPVAPAKTCTGTITWAPLTVISEPSPFPPGKLSVFVFEDDYPLNGEHDAGGPNLGATGNGPAGFEPGLGNFQIHLWDAFGGNGDFTGQMGFDMFNEPLTNSLAGTIDPATGNDACPVAKNPLMSHDGSTNDPTATGITGFIVTCPTFESDNVTYSPLAGQAVVANLMPGRWGVIATPGADRIAKGEEWLQTNTLDGQKAHDAFTRIGEPNYFQEFGPSAFHVSIGFANPKIINARLPLVCSGNDLGLPGAGNCSNSITGKIVGQRLSRPPDERLYDSGSHDAFGWTQCFVSVGDPDGEDFAFTKCDDQGNFTLTGIPSGDWRVTTFDQWNDQLVDGLSTPIRLTGNTALNLGNVAATQWQTNLWTKTFVDDLLTGVPTASSAGLGLINTALRLRDGSIENLIGTDFTGTANFNESFPLFSWYVVEADVTRYKTTGTHVVYDAGGPADGSSSCGVTGYPVCGSSSTTNPYRFLARTYDDNPLPANLSVPGAVYCATADCAGSTLAGGRVPSSATNHSTGRIDPPWVTVEGFQGFPGQNNFIEFGKAPYIPGENGGIQGHVIYASTRPFDDPYMLVQTQWEALVPNVTMNLYQEGFAADGVTPILKKVDTTTTSSWDAWAQGFRSDGFPNMNCPGQATTDLFYWTIYNQPNYLDVYNNVQHGNATTPTALPNFSQYKCYDGMHNWNQIQPATYDGRYSFPSVTGRNPTTGNTTGTNCTICVFDPDAADHFRFGKEYMLPAGKYVVEVVPPPGFELVKEEDKNILIGDNFIAPVTQQFATMSNIFIMPDQAQIASQYNANNAQNPTQNMGASPLNGIVPGFVPEPLWPCVGQTRIVPDHISLWPQSQQVSPFAGATRNLCDRKEVTVTDQMGAIAKFFLYTSTHRASKYTGGITDDYTSEFDPFSPQFGEKFAPPDLPISFKDWAGNEINRVYSDHWGAYNGMTYSTWEVNPPNPTGYSPTMMVTCMNDPGPILDTRATIVNSTGATVANPTFNQMITDPLFNPSYSQFCYDLPFMPATAQYEDTPVVPTSAFAGAGYNNVDCAYPTLTPAIKEVDGDGVGPWVSGPGSTLTITALGDQMVNNYAYAGPQATTAPYNQKTVLRHYGFGTAQGTVTIDGKTANVVNGGWSDTQIRVRVPGNLPNCAVQQQEQFGGSTAKCGQLTITTANTAAAGAPSNAKQSIDTVTVTVGGSTPTHVAATASVQDAIDAANPGDMLIIDPTCTTTTAGVVSQVACNPLTTGTTETHVPSNHSELLIMWKPVRLQGVGAASSILNANTHPAGKLDPWRRRIDCLFGLGLNGFANTIGNPTTVPPILPNSYDSTNVYSCGSTGGTAWTAFNGGTDAQQVDRGPLESIIGWDALQNANLAELLQEPGLMGALEGAGITVVGKGVAFPGQIPSNPSSDPFGFGPTNEGSFPTGTRLLTPNDCGYGSPSGGGGGGAPFQANPYPSNFFCNPSSIDGLGMTDSSQGGGAIFAHAWAHNLQIANNRIYNNTGTLSGGINIGQGEFAPAYLAGAGTVNVAPGSCSDSPDVNTQLPYCIVMFANVHNNAIMMNSSTGDELFSSAPAGAGGVSICTGSDYYKFNYNWVCGNLSTGDGGGVAQLGFIYNGSIEHNTIIFNQSTNPTLSTNGGGLAILGTPDADPTCGIATDADCLPTTANPPSDGIGPGLVINANLIMGNAAESGSGGGLRFQNINGSDVISFPSRPLEWFQVTVTNNIIANNVAGWDGAGISMQDALGVNIINNTIVSNDTTASAGVLFNTLGAPLASGSTGPGLCQSTYPPPASGVCQTTSTMQPAGLVTMQNSPQLNAAIAALPVLPTIAGQPAGSRVYCPPSHPNCARIGIPLLANNVFWQNRAFHIGVGALSAQYQQNIVTLYTGNSTTAAASQTSTGFCPAATYWDIGVRGDTGPGAHGPGNPTLASTHSVFTNTSEAGGGTNRTTNPAFFTQYCNGSRVPPESICHSTTGTVVPCGWQVPAGIADATVPNPIFSLTPTATVDEGNNWVNIQWGPLTMSNPVTATPTTSTALGNYRPGASVANQVPASSTDYNIAPLYDFFNSPRKDNAGLDIGAIEVVADTTGVTLGPTINSVVPNNAVRGSNVDITITGVNLTYTTAVVFNNSPNITVNDVTAVNSTTVTASLTFAPGTTLGPGHAFHVVTVNPDGIARSSNNMNFTVLGATVTFTGPAPALTTAGAGTATTKAGVLTVHNGNGANAGPFTFTAAPTIALVPNDNGTGTGTGTFTILAAGTTCVAGTVVAPGGACTINVQYVPPVTPVAPALLRSRATVTVTGTGLSTTTGTMTTSFNAN